MRAYGTVRDGENGNKEGGFNDHSNLPVSPDFS